MRRLTLIETAWPMKGEFRLARGGRTETRVLQGVLDGAGGRGIAEATPYPRYGETVASVRAQIETVRIALETDATRDDLLHLLPAGAARNLCDLLLWDWAAKKTGMPVWRLAGLPEPTAAPTAFTLSLAAPETMAKAAAEAKAYPILKIKMGAEDDAARLRAIRAARPDATLLVDANEGWDRSTLLALARTLAETRVALCEQPLPAGEDAVLSELAISCTLCADESVHTAQDLPALRGRYGAINVKLDKAGGLTAALQLLRTAKTAGFKIFLGCMASSSLALAPATLLMTLADWIDLDGPLLLAKDHEPALHYEGARLSPASPFLWG